MEKEQEMEYSTKRGIKYKVLWTEVRRVSNSWGLQQKYFIATVGGLRQGWEPCMFDGGCRKDIFSLQKEMLNPVGWNNAELHMLADYLNLRTMEKPRETSGSLYLFSEKPLEFNEVLQERCREFHNSQLNPGRTVWISGRDGIVFSHILKSLSSESGRIRQTLRERQCSKNSTPMSASKRTLCVLHCYAFPSIWLGCSRQTHYILNKFLLLPTTLNG